MRLLLALQLGWLWPRSGAAEAAQQELQQRAAADWHLTLLAPLASHQLAWQLRCQGQSWQRHHAPLRAAWLQQSRPRLVSGSFAGCACYSWLPPRACRQAQHQLRPSSWQLLQGTWYLVRCLLYAACQGLRHRWCAS